MNYLIYLYRLVQYHESAALYSAYSTQWKSNNNRVRIEWQTLKCRCGKPLACSFYSVLA